MYDNIGSICLSLQGKVETKAVAAIAIWTTFLFYYMIFYTMQHLLLTEGFPLQALKNYVQEDNSVPASQ